MSHVPKSFSWWCELQRKCMRGELKDHKSPRQGTCFDCWRLLEEHLKGKK